MRNKIFEYNPSTDVIRWRYEDESHDDFGWPNYGRILKKKRKTLIIKVIINGRRFKINDCRIWTRYVWL